MTDATLDPTFHTHWLAHKAPDSPTILSAQAADSFRSIPNELPGDRHHRQGNLRCLRFQERCRSHAVAARG